MVGLSYRQVAKSQKGPKKQCGIDGMLGVGNHISHYLLPMHPKRCALLVRRPVSQKAH